MIQFIGYNNFNIRYKRIYIDGKKSRYSICNAGFVYNHDTQRIHYESRGHCDHRRVLLYMDGTRKMYLVHRLVAEYFIPNPNNYKIVNHLDGYPHNNRVDNLEW